ncbi:MAG: glucose/arabinose dehydrogenase/mono/diheme cytochrome c family protein [Verrucomicrobiales bacterium]|jgi:glucose/arabinose dehydrogenase/mono/diheme cytochrome c family protein
MFSIARSPRPQCIFWLLLTAAWLGAALAPAMGQDLPPDAVTARFGKPQKKVRIFSEPFADQRFSLGADEVVVFVGQENMVRVQKSGELEARLAMIFAAQRPQFRSMAWEGDTVYEQRRELNFGSWEEQLKAVDATVIIAQFGLMESLDGPERLPEFVAAYHRLLDRFATKTRRVVLIPPATDPSKDYAVAIREIAEQRGAIYCDLYDDFHSPSIGQKDWSQPLWNNSRIHLTPAGCELTALYIAQDLFPEKAWPETKLFSALREAVVEKNRLWFNCWRPMNWAFAYGDRTTQLFGQPSQPSQPSQPIEDQPWLTQELAIYKALIDQEEARIFSLARGEVAPARTSAVQESTSDPIENLEDPAEALSAMQVADGFTVNLFAGEANAVVNPVQIAWDARGRLFVACSPTYPHIVPGAQLADYILICHDTDGDGTADKFEKFAEGLFMVQGLEPGDSGLYVCAGTELLHLRDTDGDDRADQHEVVLSGFGTGDAHQLINSISRGPEGNYWFTQGLHVNSVVETPHGITRLEKSGVWRWNPRNLKLTGFFNGAKAGHNCWGVAFDDNYQPFHKSGDRPDGYWMTPGLIELDDPAEYHPTGALFQAPAKTTSLDFIGTRHFPEKFQGCAVLGGFMANTIDLYRLHDDGAGFESERLPELLKSSNSAFRPVDVSMGPDGALYVCDFHNRLIGHYQTSYRDPGRDHSHGRIWRITANERPLIKQPDLVHLEINGLLQQLESPERWTRYQARGLLFDRPDASTEIPEFGMVIQARRHLKENRQAPQLRSRLASLVDAVNTLESEEAFSILVKVFNQPRDRFIDYALVNAARALRAYWQPLAATGKLEVDPDILTFLQKNAGAQKEKPSGQAIYENLCLNCHQADGKGLPAIYPPLANSDWVTGTNIDRVIEITIRGAQGPITVNGKPFNNIMPPSGLSDHQVSDVLTYVRTHFGYKTTTPITPEQVQQVRSRIPTDSGLWSESSR